MELGSRERRGRDLSVRSVLIRGKAIVFCRTGFPRQSGARTVSCRHFIDLMMRPDEDIRLSWTQGASMEALAHGVK